jgi:hypothetical protein
MRPDRVKRWSPWAEPAPLGVIVGNDPDHFVGAVFDNVEQEQIANELLQKAQTGDQQVAAALFQLFRAACWEQKTEYILAVLAAPPTTKERLHEEHPRASTLNFCDGTPDRCPIESFPLHRWFHCVRVFYISYRAWVPLFAFVVDIILGTRTTIASCLCRE